jgi:aryl-alcohol dehydrogenase-like predicted oxidoreductase
MTELETTMFGSTGMEITRIGFGAWAIGGGDWKFGWGPQEDDQSVEAIGRALDSGINWIDTAAAYGFGRSEKVVGQAIKDLPAQRRPYVFTKCARVPGPNGAVVGNLKRDSVLREAEASLERLGVDAIDLYQIHWPDPEPDIAEGWSALAELKERGLVKHIGVSNFNAGQLRKISGIAPVETLQPPYSLINTGADKEILPFAKEQGTGVIVYSPMGSGLLSGKMTRERIEAMPASDWRKRAAAFNEPALTANLALADRLAKVADRHGVAPGTVAVAWTLRNPAVDAAIVGFRRPDQVDPLLPAANLRLTDEDVAEIVG